MSAIRIDTDGTITCVATPDNLILRDLGEVTTRRASDCEPLNPLLRMVFRAIRATVSDSHRLADWTRHWRCLWRANLARSGGPVLGPFMNRADAISAEIDWVEANVINN